MKGRERTAKMLEWKKELIQNLREQLGRETGKYGTPKNMGAPNGPLPKDSPTWGAPLTIYDADIQNRRLTYLLQFKT